MCLVHAPTLEWFASSRRELSYLRGLRHSVAIQKGQVACWLQPVTCEPV